MKQLTRRKQFWVWLSLGLFVLSLLSLGGGKNGWLEKIRRNFTSLVNAEAETDELEHENPDRFSWFYGQRAYPRQTLPLAARTHALEQLKLAEARLQQRGFTRMMQQVQQTAWQALGPVPIGEGQTFGVPRVAVSGRVSTIVLDPGYNGASNQTVYLGAAQGGVWRSRDNGATWTPLTDNQPSLAMGAIAIDPTNPNIIYAGTGEGHRADDTYYGAGLLKSTDGGATWTQITGPLSTTNPRQPAFLNATFMQLAINPTATSTIYAATNVGFTTTASGGVGVAPIGNRGIWKSTDSGLTWRNLNPAGTDVDRSATDVLLDPQNPNRIFSAILNLGIYRSTAGGEPGSWKNSSADCQTLAYQTRIPISDASCWPPGHRSRPQPIPPFMLRSPLLTRIYWVSINLRIKGQPGPKSPRLNYLARHPIISRSRLIRRMRTSFTTALRLTASTMVARSGAAETVAKAGPT